MDYSYIQNHKDSQIEVVTILLRLIKLSGLKLRRITHNKHQLPASGLITYDFTHRGSKRKKFLVLSIIYHNCFS